MEENVENKVKKMRADLEIQVKEQQELFKITAHRNNEFLTLKEKFEDLSVGMYDDRVKFKKEMVTQMVNHDEKIKGLTMITEQLKRQLT